MPKDFRASMAERSIGRTLRMWRDQKGRTLTEAAKLARFSSAKLSLMENAVQPLDPLDVMCVGHINDRTASEWKDQVRRAQAEMTRRAAMEEVDKANTFNPDEDFIEAFPEASIICTFGAHAIPYILQTFSYSMSIHEDRISPVRAQRRDDARELWLGNPNSKETFAVYAVIAERALRRSISGGPGVANAALVNLMELSAHANVTIQVLESDSTVDAWLKSSYCHLSFPNVKHDDVVYLQDAHPGRYIEDPSICRLVRQSFQVLRQSALSPDASLERIAEIAGEMTEESYWQTISRSITSGGK
jgi:hypothetical protein